MSFYPTVIFEIDFTVASSLKTDSLIRESVCPFKTKKLIAGDTKDKRADRLSNAMHKTQ